MANRKIGAVIALDGEQQFKSAVTACTRELNTMKSALKLVEAQTDGQAKSLETLNKKHDALNDVLEATKKKQDAVAEGLQHAKDDFDRVGKETEEYKKRLTEAEEALEEMKKSGDATDEELKEQERIVKDLSQAVEKGEAAYDKAGARVQDWEKKLNDAKTETVKAEKAVDDIEDEMRDLEKATDKAADQLDDYGDEAKDAAGKTDKLDISMKSMIKNSAVNLAVDAMRAIGDKAVEAAKYVLEVGSKFEAEMDKVSAISGATGGDLARLTEKAKEMGSTTRFSASESAEAFEYMAMAGWKTNDMLAGIDGVMALAAASGADLATTSDIVTDALTAFGEGAGEAGRLADIMAAASSNANTNVEMMGETFKYAAPVAGALGISMEDTAIAVGLMANAGIKASQAGTTLRTGLTNLAKPTEQMKAAMDKYNIALVENEDGSVNLRETMISLREKLGGLEQTEQAAAAAAIFGRDSMAGWLAVVNASDEDFDTLTTAIDNSKGAAEGMSSVMENNLSGAMTTFQGALENLGLELYNKAVSPLTGAVEFATGVVSGLAKLIHGDDNALDSVTKNFLKDIRESNEEVEKSLKHAESTVGNAEAKAAEIQIYGQEFDTILGLCEQFNEVTLDTGEQAITDSSGNIVRVLGEVGTEANTVSGNLNNFASDGLGGETAIATSTGNIIEDIGAVEKKADETEGTFDEWGKDGLKDGEKAIGTSADNIGKDIEGIGTDAGDVEKDLKEWAPDGLNTTGVSASTEAARKMLGYVREDFDETTGSIKKTYVITDEFTKAKISAMVDTLGGSVDGLSEAWDRQTGRLTASKQELDKWFSTAKEVALYTALQKALDEVTEAWGKAAVNVAQSQSGLNHALDEFNKAAGTTVKTYEEWEALPENIKEEYGQLRVEVETAKDTLDESNGVMSEAEEIMENTAEALEPLKESYENVGKATEEAAEGTAGATKSTEDMEKAAKEAEDALNAVTEAVRNEQQALLDAQEIAKEARENIVNAFDEAKKAADNAFGIDAFGGWKQDWEAGMEAFNTSIQEQIDGMLAYRDNLSVVKDNMGEISPEFVKYLEDMGVGGATLVRDLAEAFRNGNADAAYELMHKYMEATDIQSGLTDTLALDALALQLGLDELGSTVEEWEGLGTAFDNCVAVIQARGGEVSEETTNSFWDAVNRAKEMGVKIPEGLADEIQNSDDPENAIQAATVKLDTAIQGQAEGLLEVAKKAGVKVPEGIEQAINDGTGDISQAYTDLVSLLSDKEVDFEAVGTSAGNAMSDSTASGITEKEEDVTGAADDVVNAAKESASTASEVFKLVGHSAMEALKGGIRDQSQEVSGALTAVLTIVKNNGTNHGNQIFPGIGSDIDAHIVSGINEKSSTVTDSFTNMMNAMGLSATTAFDNMKSAATSALTSIATAFSNTYLSFPSIQIPHVRWTWEWLGYADGGGTYYPNFYVDWYAKAMRDGMILDSPTIFGMMNGKLLGAGEAGSETVVGTSRLMDMIGDAVDDGLTSFGTSTNGINSRLEALLEVVADYMPQILEAAEADKRLSMDDNFVPMIANRTSEIIGRNARRLM